MATAKPGDTLSIFPDAGDRRIFGQDPESPPSEPFAARWDPRPDYSARDALSEVDWIGEDAQGVWLKLDPRAALYRCPRLEAIVASWSVGYGREFDWQTLETVASLTWEGWHVMTGAQERQLRNGT